MIESPPGLESSELLTFTPLEIDSEGAVISFSLIKPRFSELTDSENSSMSTLVRKIEDTPGVGEYLDVILDPMTGKTINISSKTATKIGTSMFSLIREAVEKSKSEIKLGI